MGCCFLFLSPCYFHEQPHLVIQLEKASSFFPTQIALGWSTELRKAGGISLAQLQRGGNTTNLAVWNICTDWFVHYRLGSFWTTRVLLFFLASAFIVTTWFQGVPHAMNLPAFWLQAVKGSQFSPKWGGRGIFGPSQTARFHGLLFMWIWQKWWLIGDKWVSWIFF